MSNYSPEQLSLYYFGTCPYCQRVLSTLKSLNLEIEHRNVREHRQHGEDLKAATGKSMVPCLRIRRDGADDVWMHESGDIVAFLQKEFG